MTILAALCGIFLRHITIASAPDTSSVQPLKFGGKEVERHGGLGWHDFEARWLSNGRFTTQDPKRETYYHLSPYAWCADNPIRNIDPTGKIIKTTINGVDYTYMEVDGVYGLYDSSNNRYQSHDSELFGELLEDALAAIQNGIIGNTVISKLINSPEIITVDEYVGTNLDENGEEINYGMEFGNGTDMDNNTIIWNPSSNFGGISKRGDGSFSLYRPSFIGLAHEIGHVLANILKIDDNTIWFVSKGGKKVTKGEFFACQFENVIRREHDLPQRTHYESIIIGYDIATPIEKTQIPHLSLFPVQLARLFLR